MWFKNGLKAQKLLAQGIALGINVLFRCEVLCGTEQNDLTLNADGTYLLIQSYNEK